MKSTRWTLSWRDFFKGLIMAVGVPAMYYLETLLPINTPPELKILIAAFVTYMGKNFSTDDTKAAQKTLLNQGATIVHEDQIIMPPPNTEKNP